MSFDLVPILARPIGGEVNAVNARDLHRALEVGRDFSTWIKGRIETLGLIEESDFEVFTETGENPLGGRPRLNYVVGLDAAKHIAMAERNDRGRAVRAYFIEAEKRLRASIAAPRTDPLLAAQVTATLAALAELARRVDWLTQHVATGGVIAPARHREMQREVSAVAELEVAVGKWPTKRAASRDIYREMGDVCAWGTKGTRWAELPAPLESPARSVLRRRRSDSMRLITNGRRQLALVAA